MRKFKFYIPCLAVAAFLVAGNFLPSSSSQPITAYPHVQAINPDDPGGLFIIDTKWIFPMKTSMDSDGGHKVMDDLLANYGQ